MVYGMNGQRGQYAVSRAMVALSPEEDSVLSTRITVHTARENTARLLYVALDHA